MTVSGLQIFDTLARAKRPFVPIDEGKVRMYVCGVTVYDLTHIGHARTFVSFDVVSRYLRYRGYDVTFVRNHTDIDDKIIQRANERGEDALALAQRFIDALDEDMGGLGVRHPEHEPRVTEHVDEIIAMVEALIERGHGYAVDGDVYYAVESFDGYGKLSGRKLEDMRAGERVQVDDRKRNPFDFALWKSAKPGEPSWDSPWGPGRPGWHIECSAMATAKLGNHFDIHGGGADLTFPHHENEIAQAEGATGEHFANYWMHVAMLNIDGEKMSKSLDNFWTVRDVLKQYSPEAIRYFMLTAHYRKPVNYSQTNLELARHRVLYLHRTRKSIAELWTRTERPEPDAELLADYRAQLGAAMDDDFNTPVTLAVVGEAAKRVNELLNTKKIGKKADVRARIAAIEEFFTDFAEVTGVLEGDTDGVLADIQQRQIEQLDIDEDKVREMIAARVQARTDKDWAEADRLRDDLVAMNIELMDGPEGTDWRVAAPEPE